MSETQTDRLEPQVVPLLNTLPALGPAAIRILTATRMVVNLAERCRIVPRCRELHRQERLTRMSHDTVSADTTHTGIPTREDGSTRRHTERIIAGGVIEPASLSLDYSQTDHRAS